MSAVAPPVSRSAQSATRAGTRPIRLSVGWTLGLILVTSSSLRLLLALTKETPTYLPDEFLYSDLARSIALEGRLALRGAPITFPAILEPLLAAPAWLPGDVELAYRLTQGLHAVAMSLAAVPGYLIVRRLTDSTTWGLAGALLTVVGPALVLTSFVTADAIGFTLALTAIAAWLSLAERPSVRREAGFLAIAGLATLGRAQYAALFFGAVVSAAWMEGFRPARVIRRFPLLIGSLGAAFIVLLAVGPSRLLGPYSGLLHALAQVSGLRSTAGTQLQGLLLATFVVLLPGAIVGLVAALVRPRSRTELAFASLVLPVAVALLAQAALVAATLDSDRFMERYVLVPTVLCLPAFLLSIGRGRWTAFGVVTISAALALAFARLPVSALTGGLGLTESQVLRAIGWLEGSWTVGSTSLAISLAACALCLIAAIVAVRPSLAPVAVAFAVICGGLASFAAHAFDLENARRAAQRWLPVSEYRWVDELSSGSVTFVATAGTPLALAGETTFWNREVRDVMLLDGVKPLDHGAYLAGGIRSNGALTADGIPVKGRLLVSRHGSEVDLRGASLVRERGPLALYSAPRPGVRVAWAMDRGSDGFLAAQGRLRVWPAVTPGLQAVRLRFRGTGDGRRVTLTLEAPGYRRVLHLASSARASVRVPVNQEEPWTLEFAARPFTLEGGRAVGVRADAPQLLTSMRSVSSR